MTALLFGVVAWLDRRLAPQVPVLPVWEPGPCAHHAATGCPPSCTLRTPVAVAAVLAHPTQDGTR